MVGMGLSRRSGLSYFGIIERAFYALMTAWLGVVAAMLIAASH